MSTKTQEAPASEITQSHETKPKTFPLGGKSMTVADFQRSLADMPGDKSLVLSFEEGWRNEQTWTDTAQKGFISGMSEDAENVYLTVGQLI